MTGKKTNNSEKNKEKCRCNNLKLFDPGSSFNVLCLNICLLCVGFSFLNCFGKKDDLGYKNTRKATNEYVN